eukprot:TRINITY_DN5302_c0_g1_i2.p1 TRINITY_DN5302_c0_g1~~TRINITY_DN5302_c0_g1_i2.p1  ORF type:complete len:146 (-),score=15.38 TRINITY_DN5302_c0_g1_i2:31-411(-)
MSDLETKFRKCVSFIEGLPKDAPYQASTAEKLQFYSLFKQSTEGPVKGKSPSRLNIVAKTKWLLFVLSFAIFAIFILFSKQFEFHLNWKNQFAFCGGEYFLFFLYWMGIIGFFVACFEILKDFSEK